MKTKVFYTLLALVLIVGLNINTFAQEESSEQEYKTLFTNKKGQTEHGGYLGLTIGYTDIDAKPALELGGRAAWVINHQFAFGFAGKGFFNNLDKPTPALDSDYFLAGGYGGLFFQPILFPKAPVHVSFPIILGAGGVYLNPRENHKYHWDYDYNYDYSYDSDFFLVFEPGVEVEFNMLRYLRMAVGASYKFTNDVNLVYEYTVDGQEEKNTINVSPSALDNFSVNLSIMFGWF